MRNQWTRNVMGRRTVLKAAAAVGTAVLGAPYVARAQGAPINIGVLLPFTGSQGAYGPDMRKAAEVTTKMINDGGGILNGRKFRGRNETDASHDPSSQGVGTVASRCGALTTLVDLRRYSGRNPCGR